MSVIISLTILLKKKTSITVLVDQLNSIVIPNNAFIVNIFTPVIIENSKHQYNYSDSGIFKLESIEYHFNIGAHVDENNETSSIEFSTSNNKLKIILFENEDLLYSTALRIFESSNFKNFLLDVDGDLTLKKIERLYSENKKNDLEKEGYRIIFSDPN